MKSFIASPSKSSTISITLEFITALGQLHDRATNLTDSAKDVADITCEAQTMKMYHEKLLNAAELLGRYKALLEKDHSALKQVHGNMTLWDEAISRKFNR